MDDVDLSGKVVSPSRLAHVVLRTPKFKPMVAFYKAFLGAEAVIETDEIAFLTYDDEHHRVALLSVPGCVDKVRNSAGLEHIAFTFNSLADLATAYRQRKAREIVPVWCVNHGPTTSMYYTDPDGNFIETQNPMGVDFDPEDLITRLKSGESEADIKKRPKCGPRNLQDTPILNPSATVVKDSYEPIVNVA
ncbi:Glyoxalase/Bleomycin resistance protein/Dihydroxybiphenyl dioxygenase [Hypoxylon sp. NC1633]|nr:Glyoxalase/Bleomycin resistance protein/Dihydroxybiphenyl dioxygenase [Hypoxylon sp. NC1633]